MADNDANETQDVNAAGEITTDLFADEADDTAAEDSSSKEKKSEAATKVEEPAKGTETEGEDKSTDADKTDEEKSEEEPAAEGDDAKAEETDTEQPNPRSAEARKEELNKEIRELNAKKTELRQTVAELNSKVYQPLTEEQLVEAGADPADARVQAAEERLKLVEFNTHVADTNANLNIESAQVMSDFPEFDPNSEDYNEELASEANALYKKVSGAKRDPKTGLIYDVAVFPYEIYQRIALTHRAGARTGQVKGQQSTEKMLQAAETTASAAPKPKKSDPLTALWDEKD